MPYEVGTQHQHRLTGLTCTVTAYDGERQRVIIQLEDGREIQEVPFADLLDLPTAPSHSGPLPIQEPGPTEGHPSPAEDTDRNEAEDKRTGWPPPRRSA